MIKMTRVIAIIDDHPEIKCRNIIGTLIEKEIEFEFFKSINSFLKAVHSYHERYCGIILDMQLPQYDDEPFSLKEDGGESILKRLSSRNIDIPVLLNTSTYVPEEKFLLQHYKNVYGVINGGYETAEEFEKFRAFVKLVKEQM